ncbi:DUF3306 domain-containing protein [Palleronia abyssalis]|uniref:DUF3306 domain-containing protein n=1 Tax=Palleronia abyssalis TaxID=1501240 RepID=A0A2R8BYC0_9RHOB|nr:DUF3306 domain-containing protein [Palleronia abyssalis]SPJ25150.1 hypothetical protein PAA8504_02997 [Palleronia abyssalis]
MPDRPDFWSRRRRAVAAEEARVSEAAPERLAEDPHAGMDDESLLKMLGLPDPETLTPHDAAAFMAREVSGQLRKRAMRALFSRHPGLSLPDGLLDYDDDYTDAAVNMRPPKTVWTSIQKVAEAVMEPESQPEVTDTPDPEIERPAFKEEEPDLPTPRRMAFSFPEDTV